MALEQTLAMIKPDAVAKNYTGKIIAMIEESGLHIVAAKMLRISIVQAEELYAEHKGKPFFEPLLEFMTSGPVMVLVLEGKNAVQALRKLMGATVPAEAEKGTIRQLYADANYTGKVIKNAIHGSDSTETASREIDFFFDQQDLCVRG
jgi:nucleoside-diphosphate kinase